MAITKILKSCFCLAVALSGLAQAHGDFVAGPIFSDFDLTLEPGHRTEAAGPFYYSQQIESQRQIGVPPLFSWTHDPDLELTEIDLGYPIISYRRYGGEYRIQIYQLISWAGGRTQNEDPNRRFTLFPFYFQQRNSVDPSGDYTALLPIFGHLRNRLFRDDIRFLMFPLYSETRKKDVITDNYLYPIFHKRLGNRLAGWQVWPIVGSEYKGVTYRTNQTDEVEIIGGHHRFFAVWPFYLHDWTGLGTDNPQESFSVIPFYSRIRSSQRDSTSYGWPFGYTKIHDREHKYEERQFLGPLYVSAHGEGKNTSRVFPFYSHSSTTNKESHWYMWPVYKVNRLHSDPLDRTRTRILFFLYSDTVEKNTQSGESLRRVEMWPLFSSRREMDGNKRLQILSIVEPLLPNNKSVARDFAPVYSIWRSEKNAKTSASSQSLLWNLYRREKSPEAKKLSLLFGLFQYQSSSEGKNWRVCYFPMGKKNVKTTAPKP